MLATEFTSPLKFDINLSNDSLLSHSQKHHELVAWLQLINNLQQTCQSHQATTSLLKSGLLKLVICRLVTTC